jgi:hypothetical protein
MKKYRSPDQHNGKVKGREKFIVPVPLVTIPGEKNIRGPGLHLPNQMLVDEGDNFKEEKRTYRDPCDLGD